MCGIVGIWSSKLSLDERKQLLDTMMPAIRYRGGDGEGQWHDTQGPCSLGHTRLAIVGPQSQPIESQDHVLVINGEIYNWKELARSETLAAEDSYECDSELLIPLYQEHGLDFVHYVRGMFAFSLYDTRSKTLLLGRDPFGQKPLYYLEHQDGLFFSSSPGSLLALPQYTRVADLESLIVPLIGNFHHVLAPHTAYKNIKSIPFGSMYRVRSNDERSLHSYLSSFKRRNQFSAHDVKDRLENVIRQQASVAGSGLLCSGGYDSSVIASVLQSHGSHPYVTAYSNATVERDAVRELAARHKVTSYEQRLTLQGVLYDMEALLDIWNEPVCVWSMTALTASARCAAEHSLRVLLSGNGADELFFGYDGHKKTYVASLLGSSIPWIEKLIPSLGVMKLPAGERKLARYKQYIQQLFTAIPEFHDHIDRELLVSRFQESFAHVCSLLPDAAYIEESNIVGLLLENAHATMMSGDVPGLLEHVEIRSPFLDYTLVEAVLGTPLEERISIEGPRKKLLRTLYPGVSPLSQKRGLGQILPDCFYRQEFWFEMLAVFEKIENVQNPLYHILLSSLGDVVDGERQEILPLLPRMLALLWFLYLQEEREPLASYLFEHLAEQFCDSSRRGGDESVTNTVRGQP